MNADGTFNATDQRPGFPWQTQHTNSRNNTSIWPINRPVPLNYDIPMDWHHMIPWNVLRNSWSALAASGRWEVIELWLSLLSVDEATNRLDEMKAGTLNGVDRLSVTEKMCWAKWNLVEGPNNTNRTDDPGGEAFDKFSGSQFSSNVRDRSQTLNLIYTLVSGWAVNKADLGKDQTKVLASYFEGLRSYKNSPIPMFEGKAWAVVNEGRIDKFGLATPPAGRHPTWRKA